MLPRTGLARNNFRLARNPSRVDAKRGVYFLQADFHDRSLSRGQKLSRRASEERGYKTLSDFSPRVLASQAWFLFQIEQDFHLLSQTSEWS